MPMGLMGCGVWKSILSETVDFFKHIRFKVNKGNKVLFWMDLWCTSEPLNILFSCFNLALAKNGLVQDHMIRSRVFCSWDLKPRRNLNDWEIEEMGCLMDILEKYQLGD